MGRSGDGKRNILWGWPKQNYPITSHATTALCKECNQIRLYAERQPESRFRVMKVGRDVTVDDDGNYMSRFMNVRIKIKNK